MKPRLGALIKAGRVGFLKVRGDLIGFRMWSPTAHAKNTRCEDRGELAHALISA